MVTWRFCIYSSDLQNYLSSPTGRQRCVGKAAQTLFIKLIAKNFGFRKSLQKKFLRNWTTFSWSISQSISINFKYNSDELNHKSIIESKKIGEKGGFRLVNNQSSIIFYVFFFSLGSFMPSGHFATCFFKSLIKTALK